MLKKISLVIMILILVFPPFAWGGWDIWSQSFIHILTLCILFLIFLRWYNLRRLNRASFLSRFNSTPVLKILLIFALILYISYIFAYDKFLARMELYNWINYIIIFLLMQFVFMEYKKYIITIFSFMGTVLSFIAISQYLYGKPASSTMNNPNIFAGYLLMIIPLGFYQLFVVYKNRYSLILRICTLASVLIMIAAFLSTRSWAAMFALVLGSIIFIYLQRGKEIFIRYWYAWLFAFIGFIYLVGLKLSQKGAFHRIWWWQDSINIIKEHLLFGVGLGNYSIVSVGKSALGDVHSLYVHNLYLQMASETGIISILIFVFLISLLLKKAIISLATAQDKIILLSIFSVLLYSFFDYSLIIPANAITFWVILGIITTHPYQVVQNQVVQCGKEATTSGEIINPRLRHNLIVFLTGCLLFISMTFYSLMPFFSCRAWAQGKYLMEEDRLEIANKRFLQGIEYDNEYPLNYLGLAELFIRRFRVSGKESYLAEAIIELERVTNIENKWDLSNYSILARDFYNRGEYLKAEGMIRGAIDKYELAYGLEKTERK